MDMEDMEATVVLEDITAMEVLEDTMALEVMVDIMIIIVMADTTIIGEIIIGVDKVIMHLTQITTKRTDVQFQME
jgi:hypothetical protein